MQSILEMAASNALLAAILAAAAVIVARLVRRPQIVYWLWLLVFMKLLTPPIFHVPVSLPGKAKMEAATPPASKLAGEQAVAAVASRDVKIATADSQAGNEADAKEAPEGELMPHRAIRPGPLAPPLPREAGERPTVAAAPHETEEAADRHAFGNLPWQSLLLGTALMGSLLWFALAASRLAHFGRWVRHARPAPGPLQAVAQDMAGRFGLRRAPEVRVLDAQVPPLLWFSCGRAVIALPAGLLEQLDEKGQSFLVAHELAHYCRGDHWVRWAEAVALGLYWWHPVAWWARRRLHQTEEECCDERVVRAMPGDAKAYAHTLLTAVEFLSVGRPRLPALACGMDEVGTLRQRIESVLAGPMPRGMPWIGIVAVVLLAAATLPWSARTSSAIADAAPSMMTSMPSGLEQQAAAPAATAGKTSPGPVAVSGVVRSPDGKSVAGAAVYLICEEDGEFASDKNKLVYVALPEEQQANSHEDRAATRRPAVVETTTDASGRFRAEVDTRSLKHPTIKAATCARGYGLASQALKDTEREITIEMPKEATVQGRLLTANGTPATGATVKVVGIGDYGENGLNVESETPDSDLPRYWPRPVATNDDGRFSLAGMPAGSHVQLEVRHPACAREDLTVDTGLGETDQTRERDVSLLPPSFRHSLSPARPVEGIVTAADTGKPLANVLVNVTPMGRQGGMEVNTHTDSRGYYRVSDRAGSMWWVAAYPSPDSGYFAMAKNIEHWPAGAVTLVHDFALPHGKLIHGRVLDGQTGKAIAGASVEYHASRKNALNKSVSEGSEYEFRSPILTDDEGRFQLAALSGPGYLTVERDRLADAAGTDRPSEFCCSVRRPRTGREQIGRLRPHAGRGDAPPRLRRPRGGRKGPGGIAAWRNARCGCRGRGQGRWRRRRWSDCHCAATAFNPRIASLLG